MVTKCSTLVGSVFSICRSTSYANNGPHRVSNKKNLVILVLSQEV
jgi:hypothetical protein